MRSFAIMVCFAVTPVAAAPAFPGGDFGSKDGCAYARTGESSGADDFLLLNAEGIVTATAVCTLRSATPKGKSAFRVVVSCETEGKRDAGGERGEAVFANDAWTVRLADGTVFGPAKRCT